MVHIRVCCVVQYMLSTLTVLPGSATRELQYKIHGPNQPMSAKGKMTVDAVQNLDYLDQCTMAYKGIYSTRFPYKAEDTALNGSRPTRYSRTELKMYIGCDRVEKTRGGVGNGSAPLIML